MKEKYVQSPMANFFALLSSSSTLLCCALPAILVSMGAGAVFANIISVFPALTVVSRFKVEITVVTLIILVAVGVLHSKTAKMPCPADPNLGRACLKSRKRSRVVYYLSCIVFVTASDEDYTRSVSYTHLTLPTTPYV